MARRKSDKTIFVISGIRGVVTALAVIIFLSVILVFSKDVYRLTTRIFQDSKKTENAATQNQAAVAEISKDIKPESGKIYLVETGRVIGELNHSYQNGISKIEINIEVVPNNEVANHYHAWLLKNPKTEEKAISLGELYRPGTGEHRDFYILDATLEGDLKDFTTVIITPRLENSEEIIKTKLMEGNFR